MLLDATWHGLQIGSVPQMPPYNMWHTVNGFMVSVSFLTAAGPKPTMSSAFDFILTSASVTFTKAGLNPQPRHDNRDPADQARWFFICSSVFFVFNLLLVNARGLIRLLVSRKKQFGSRSPD
ncbi:hypothetical protein N9L19_01260 [bacterium]|nr:hypothetical protein [bacterium]